MRPPLEKSGHIRGVVIVEGLIIRINEQFVLETLCSFLGVTQSSEGGEKHRMCLRKCKAV